MTPNQKMNFVQLPFEEATHSSLKDIISLNSGLIKELLESTSSHSELFGSSKLRELNKPNVDQWKKPNSDNTKRLRFFKAIMRFLHPSHLELLDVSQIKRLLSLSTIQKLLSRPEFLNHSINENQSNLLVTMQGKALEVLTNVHIKSDMRFRDTIDSMNINLNNPFAREDIRRYNRNNKYLNQTYQEDFKIDQFCINILKDFFPNVTGIWLDYTQALPANILKLVRVSYESGFLDVEDTKAIIPLLYKAAESLTKLENAWKEKIESLPKASDLDPDSINNENREDKMEDMMKVISAMRIVKDVRNVLAVCREHLACILIQAITLLYDDYFTKNYNDFIQRPNKKINKEAERRVIQKDCEQFFPFFDPVVNQTIMFVTMNYLSNSFWLRDKQAQTQNSSAAIDLLFSYVTTDDRDIFLTSIRSTTQTDLKFFESIYNLEDSINDCTRDIAQNLRVIIDLIGNGCFDQDSGSACKQFTSIKQINTKREVKLLDTQESLWTLVSNQLNVINEMAKKGEGMYDQDSQFKYKVGFVRYCVPLLLISLADFIHEYFGETSRKNTMTQIFETLFSLCQGNNMSKAQVFKDQGVRHLLRLMKRHNKHSFLFLCELTQEHNISEYVTGVVFEEILVIYEKYLEDVLGDMDDMNTDEFDTDSWLLLLLLNKFIDRLFKSQFASEQIKMTTALKAQQSTYVSLGSQILPRFLNMLEHDEDTKNAENYDKMIPERLFGPGNELELLKDFERREMNIVERKNLMLQFCFFALKAFNRVCRNVYAHKVHACFTNHPEVGNMIEKVEDFLFTNRPEPQRICVNKFNAMEFIKLITNFKIIPEANMLIERQLEFTNINVLESDKPFEIIIKSIKKIAEYNQSSLNIAGIGYIMGAVVPMIYKYSTATSNLVVFNSEVALSKAKDQIKQVILSLNDNSLVISQICAQHSPPISLFDDLEKFVKHQEELENKRNKFDKQDEDDDDEEDNDEQDRDEVGATALKSYCDKITKFCENLVANSKHKTELDMFKSMSYEEYEDWLDSTGFTEEISDPSQIEKLRVLNQFIQVYRDLKADYLEREEEPNLLGYFRKNETSLMGVFRAMVDKCFSDPRTSFVQKRDDFDLQDDEKKATGLVKLGMEIDNNIKKAEAESKRGYLANHFPLNSFWVSTSIRNYVKILDKLLSNVSNCRSEFYRFITENKENSEGKIIESQLRDPNRQGIITLLARIHSDLVFMLNTSPTQKPMFWTLVEIYSMISNVFKNFCEGNFMEFKVFMSKFRPFIKEEPDWNLFIPETNEYDSPIDWTEGEYKDLLEQIRIGKSSEYRLSLTNIFSNELNFVLQSTKLCLNKEEELTHSDQSDRSISLALPLVNLINELVTGPCTENQEQVMDERFLKNINGIIMRIISDLNSEFYDFKHSCLLLIISMTEGFPENNLKLISIRIPASAFIEQITRMMKKLYVRQILIDGDYDDKVIECLKQREQDKRQTEQLEQASNSKNDPNEVAQPSIRGNSLFKPSSFSGQGSKLQNEEPSHTPEESDDKKDPKDKFSVITDKREDKVDIQDWEELFSFYIFKEDFSQGKIFDMVFRMKSLWSNLKTSKSHRGRLEEVLSQATNYFEKSAQKKIEVEQNSIFYFLKKITLQVEILDPSAQSNMVQFPAIPQCFKLSNEVKRVYRSKCDISDAGQKMLDLIRNYKVFDIQMDFNLRTYRHYGFWYYLMSKDFFKYYMIISWFTGLALVLTIIATTIKSAGELKYRDTSSKVAVLVLAVFHITFSSLVLLFWTVTRYFVQYRQVKEEYSINNPGEVITSFTKFRIGFIESFLKQPEINSMMLHVTFSVLGLILSRFWFSFNLMLIVNISNTAKFVITSVTKHINQLFITLLLAIFMVYSYSLLIGEYYFTQFDGLDMDVCKHASSCFFYVLSLGLRNGGGIGDSMITRPHGNEQFYIRLLMDLSFFILVNFVALNIIFGIIIDTFGQLRDEQNERSLDTANNCFVCGFDRGDFGKARKNFEKHISQEHDPWLYIYYILYMKDKGEDELSGMEYHCWSCVQEGSTDFIPIGNTTYLNRTYEEEEDVEGAVQILNEKADALNDYIQNNFSTLWDMIDKGMILDLPQRHHLLAKDEEDEEDEE